MCDGNGGGTMAAIVDSDHPPVASLAGLPQNQWRRTMLNGEPQSGREIHRIEARLLRLPAHRREPRAIENDR